ncbi:MAG TPA: hypothetical protein PKA60_00555 [Candidatus Paceibacterota bacterium]|nr:hypothetical protein [Candidatus Paceibacterota bacterium]
MTKRISADQIVSVMVKIRPSIMLPGEIGLFAARDISIGEVIGNGFPSTPMYLCSWEEYPKLDDATKEYVDKYCLGTPQGFYTYKNPHFMTTCWHMNHSCDGNVGFGGEDGDFVAIRDICINSELVYDYGLMESNPRFRMNCLCGSPNCRGVITGCDWKKLQKTDSFRHMHPYLKGL